MSVTCAKDLQPGDVVTRPASGLTYYTAWRHTVTGHGDHLPGGGAYIGDVVFTEFDGGKDRPYANKDWQRAGGHMSHANMDTVLSTPGTEVWRAGKRVHPFVYNPESEGTNM